jgi:hypothetical protein
MLLAVGGLGRAMVANPLRGGCRRLMINGVAIAAMVLPLAPAGSCWWKIAGENQFQ